MLPVVRALNWRFERPVVRDEWWWSPNAAVACRFTKQLIGDAAYSWDRVDSRVFNTAGRESRRHLASLGLKYIF